MISKYAVYANVTKVTWHDGKERYLILCPDLYMLFDNTYLHMVRSYNDWTEEEFTCEGCPFHGLSSLIQGYLHGRVQQECHLMDIGHNDHLCDTFDEVRAIIEPFYDEMFGRE